ncbi:MAG: hypothetical protein HYV01_10360 [Deltaproteobacteria bacterium]|nr:hypothetical protein [Deltaproteobacteria bacterium]
MHYETGWRDVLNDGFLGTAGDLRAVAGPPSENTGSHGGQALDGSKVTSGWNHVEKLESHDSLRAFVEIERLIGKIYFRFSHLFLHHSTLRDFWWEMGMAKERQAAILTAIKVASQNCAGNSETGIGCDGTEKLKGQLKAYLSKGTPAITTEEAFTKALEIEDSEKGMLSKFVESPSRISTRRKVKMENPVKEIMRLAREERADLIVLALKGRSLECGR